MICRQCGTEISDKALICYRCGRATDDPVAAVRAGKRGPWAGVMTLVALVALVLAGVFMGQVATGDVPRWASWTLAGLAAVLLAWRLAKRGTT